MKDTTCLYCSKEFKTKRSSRKYCSALCRQYAYMSRKGFEFKHTAYIGDIVTIEEEGEKIHIGLIGNTIAEVIPHDDKKVTVNDNNIFHNDRLLNTSSTIHIDNKENAGIDSKKLSVSGQAENYAEDIINGIPVKKENSITVNDNKEITVIDNNKSSINAGKLISEKSEWIAYRNSFLNDLDELYKRNYQGMPFSKRYYRWWSSDDWAYVSTCNSALYYILHKLLYFDRSIEPVSVRELQELHEDVYYEQQSYCYGLLPEEYPYFDLFKQLENSISQWAGYCNEHQKICFKIHPAFKLKIYCILRQMKPESDQEYYVLSKYDKENE